MNRNERENEICREFDERIKVVPVTLARLELAEALAREEEIAAQHRVHLTALRRGLIVSVLCNIVVFAILVTVLFIGGR